MPSPETAGFADIFFGIYALVCKSVVCSNKAKAHLSANTPLRTLTALSIVWDSSLESGAESRKIDKKIFRKVPCGPRDREFPLVQGPVSDFANDLRIYPRAGAVSKKFSCGHHFCRNRRVQPDEQ
jgi:hypothetical protein